MRENKLHEDQKYIDGLADNNATVIKGIYVKFSSRVIQYISHNNGDAYDAQDVIQETIIAIYNQAKQQKLQLTCPFETYFFYLCKRKWLNQLKQNFDEAKSIELTELDTDHVAKEISHETYVFEKNHTLYNEKFQQLDDACKEVLKATFSMKPKDQVSKSLNITYTAAIKQKVLCIGELTQNVLNTPEFNPHNDKFIDEQEFIQCEKYLLGDLTKDKLSFFNERLRSDDQFKQAFKIYKDISDHLIHEITNERPISDFKANLDVISSQYFNTIHDKDMNSVASSKSHFYKYVIIVCVIIFIGFLVFKLIVES